MAFAQVQTKSGTRFGGGTTLAITLTSSPTNGNTLIAVISYNNSTASRVSSISQTGATWARVVQSQDGSGNADCGTEIWAAFNVSGASTSITVNFAAASLVATGMFAEYSGFTSAAAADKTASTDDGTAGGPATTIDSGQTATSSVANEVWIAGFAVDDRSNITSYTPSNSFSNVMAGNRGGFGAYYDERIVSSQGQAQDKPALGGTTGSGWAGAVATFFNTPPPPASLATFYSND